jgi:hypothetical protein
LQNHHHQVSESSDLEKLRLISAIFRLMANRLNAHFFLCQWSWFVVYDLLSVQVVLVVRSFQVALLSSNLQCGNNVDNPIRRLFDYEFSPALTVFINLLTYVELS